MIKALISKIFLKKYKTILITLSDHLVMWTKKIYPYKKHAQGFVRIAFGTPHVKWSTSWIFSV